MIPEKYQEDSLASQKESGQKYVKMFSEKSVKALLDFERQKSSSAVMDLCFALKEIKGTPTLKDLVKLAKRLKRPSADKGAL